MKILDLWILDLLIGFLWWSAQKTHI